MNLVRHALRGALVVSLLAAGAVPLAATPAHAVAPTGTTTLLTPAQDEIVGGNPTFSWTAVPGAVRYRVQASTSDLFDPVVYTVDTVNLHATPVNALPVGPLYWRVAPTDGGSGVGSFTGGYFVREWASAPNVTGPPAAHVLTYPQDPLLFTWDPLEGAQRYNIQIDDEVNFISPQVSTSTVNTSYTLTDPQTNDHDFYWRVQGVSGTVVSPWSEPRPYRVEWPVKPVLLYPGVGESITDVVFRWSPVAGAATYQLQVSSNHDFSNNMAADVRVKGTSFSPAANNALAAASYYWRVRAIDARQGGVQNFGAWSERIATGPGLTAPAQFTRVWPDRPELLTPPNGELNTPAPIFRWKPVPYASHYELQISYDANFSPLAIKKCYTNNTSFTPYDMVSGSTPPVPASCEITISYMKLNQVVYWRVRGIDHPSTTIFGQWSDPGEFLYRHAPATPLSPPNGLDTAVPALRWAPVVGVARYKVTITQIDTGSQQVTETYGNSYTPTNLSSGKSYSWYVQSIDDQGRIGAPPMAQYVWTFKYVPATTDATSIALLGPADGEGSPLWPEFRWAPLAGATSYKVYYAEIGSSLMTPLGTTNTTALTPTLVPPAAKPYAWRVDGHNGSTVIAESPLSTFVIQDLPLVTGMLPEKCASETECVNTPETPQLSWTPTPHTSTYHVWIANDPDFTNVVRTYETNYPSLTPREALPDSEAGQAYYWFVQPCRGVLVNCGKADRTTFPTASAFRKRSLPVELLSPADGAVVPGEGATGPETVTFSWAEYAGTNSRAVPPAAQGARVYRIQVSTSHRFESILDTADVDQTTYTPHQKTYPEGPLYWRVAAVDGSGHELTYSEPRLLTKATPGLVAKVPAPGAVVNGTPYFTWGAQAHAKDYELEVYANGDDRFSPANKIAISTSSLSLTRLTAFTPTKALAIGDYAWRVRRNDADGRPGPWTSGGVFTVASATPTLLAPAPGTVFTGNDLLFSWTGVTGAARYKFESSASAGFATLTENVTTVMTTWAPTVKYADGTIHWRVKVLDGDNHVVAVSAPSSIVKDGTSPTVTTKAPTAAAPISGGAFTATFSEQVKGLSASTFLMKGAASGAVPGTVTPGVTTATTTATFTPSGPLLPGETYTLSVTNGVTDLNGNALVPASWTVRTELAVDGVSPAVLQYWDRDTSSSASGGGFLASRTTGAKVRYSFTGTSASILGKRAPDGGYAEVWVDNAKAATVHFYSSTTRYKQLIWSKTGLANTTHTVELRVLGTKPSSASSSWVYPDAFRYGATTLEETSAKVVQAHRNVALSGALGRSYVLMTHTASGDNSSQPYVLLRFKGTGVSWKAVRGYSGGIGKVYVDGVAKSSVDTYGTPSTSGQTVWSINGLANGVHTLKIVATGTRRSGSKGYNVTVDSFGVV